MLRLVIGMIVFHWLRVLGVLLRFVRPNRKDGAHPSLYNAQRPNFLGQFTKRIFPGITPMILLPRET